MDMRGTLPSTMTAQDDNPVIPHPDYMIVTIRQTALKRQSLPSQKNNKDVIEEVHNRSKILPGISTQDGSHLRRRGH